MIANESVEIEEQKDGTYIYPVIGNKRGIGWTMYVFKDGSADLYQKCGITGALLGKPIHLPAPTGFVK